jgi:uncharacterized protein (TIGR02646 family)
MIRLIDEPPREAVLAQLGAWQAEVDAVPDYRERVAEAKRLFKQRNRADNPTFDLVRGALRAMCGDAEWCCYCERSQASEIDHVRPKGLYPDAVFLWSNFLWVCGRCNKLKCDRFGIIAGEHIRRLPRGAPAEPPEGTPALIDPRVEDPLDFFWLDLHYFVLAPAHGLSRLAWDRADYTIKTLRLNDDALAVQRHRAYYIFAHEMQAYLAACGRGDTPLQCDGYRARVRREPHKVVWESMKRRPSELEPHIAALFHAAPECFEW